MLVCLFLYLGVHKNVLFMFSGVVVLGRTNDETRKTYVNNYYNYSMGGVDIVDQMMSALTCRFKSDRWPMNTSKFSLFFYFKRESFTGKFVHLRP
jgi:hypothetical protein